MQIGYSITSISMISLYFAGNPVIYVKFRFSLVSIMNIFVLFIV
jgi:hypothetical protein